MNIKLDLNEQLLRTWTRASGFWCSKRRNYFYFFCWWARAQADKNHS